MSRLVVLITAVFLTPLSFAQDGLPALISSRSAREPSLASLPGGDCAIAWVRPNDAAGHTRIEFRQRQNSLWQSVETPCPERPGVQVSEPFLRLDTFGNPHLIWVTSEKQTTGIEYAFRLSSNWIRFGFLSEPSSRKIEHPVMALRPPNGATRHTDEVFFAWQERAGSNYRICSVVIDAAAEIHRFVLEGEESSRYVVYPDLLELPPAEPGGEPRIGLCWFNLADPQTRIEMRAWNDRSSQWEPVALPDWRPEYLQTLPLPLSSGSAEPSLLGVDRKDQLFLSTGEDEKYLLTDQPHVRNRFPRSGRPVGGAFALIWQQETNAGVELAQAALHPNRGIYATPLASTDDPFLPSDPAVAITHDSLLAVWVGAAVGVWGEGVSANPAPPSGIFFSETRIPKNAWRPLIPSTEDSAP